MEMIINELESDFDKLLNNIIIEDMKNSFKELSENIKDKGSQEAVEYINNNLTRFNEITKAGEVIAKLLSDSNNDDAKKLEKVLSFKGFDDDFKYSLLEETILSPEDKNNIHEVYGNGIAIEEKPIINDQNIHDNIPSIIYNEAITSESGKVDADFLKSKLGSINVSDDDVNEVTELINSGILWSSFEKPEVNKTPIMGEKKTPEIINTPSRSRSSPSSYKSGSFSSSSFIPSASSFSGYPIMMTPMTSSYRSGSAGGFGRMINSRSNDVEVHTSGGSLLMKQSLNEVIEEDSYQEELNNNLFQNYNYVLVGINNESKLTEIYVNNFNWFNNNFNIFSKTQLEDKFSDIKENVRKLLFDVSMNIYDNASPDNLDFETMNILYEDYIPGLKSILNVENNHYTFKNESTCEKVKEVLTKVNGINDNISKYNNDIQENINDLITNLREVGNSEIKDANEIQEKLFNRIF